MPKLDPITVNPHMSLGQPAIRGTRIPVSVILEMLAAGKTGRDLLGAYLEHTEEVFSRRCAMRRRLSPDRPLRGRTPSGWACYWDIHTLHKIDAAIYARR